MKFQEYPYQRPNLTEEEQHLHQLFTRLKEAPHLEEAKEVFLAIDQVFKHLESLSNYAYIRNTLNSEDSFYKDEFNFWAESQPKMEALKDRFNALCLEHSLRPALEKHFGRTFFVNAEQARKTFSPEIEEEITEEIKVGNEYDELCASSVVQFRGKECNLTELNNLLNSKDKEERHEAAKCLDQFFRENEDRFEDIYERLVQIRHRMAQKLGYENFIPLAYHRMGRQGYDQKDVEKYRETIYKHIVPIHQSLIQKQAQRLGVDKLRFVDESLIFLSGNPKPKGKEEELLEKAQKMYDELSPETGAFFRMMREKNLLDLSNRLHKQQGGYCHLIPEEGLPFIFANFVGSAHDVEVLTHEAGHAFQAYSACQTQELLEYYWPSVEACEIHSTSMEYLTWPWMESFFAEDTAKFYYKHLADVVRFLPYGVLVDHFQHEIYAHPEWKKEDRQACWRRLEQHYLPHRDYEGLPFFNQGTYWYRQGHIFTAPFYYIDYTLAFVCSLQFWHLDRQNHKETWEKYLKLCKLGGSQDFLSLLKSVDLESPFSDTCIPKVFASVRAYLDSVDDRQF